MTSALSAWRRCVDRHPERPAAWGDRRATLDRWRSTDLARQQRAVAASGVGSRSTMPTSPIVGYETPLHARLS